MIKKLQLRGISRTPSDRMTSDGGCAESLNVQLHAGEIAPMPKPEMMKDQAGNKISLDGDILFIHKGIGYEHLISREGQSLTFVSTIGEVASGSLNVTLDIDESINDLTAIGNTIILSTSKDMYYVLWKEGEYHFLGHQIPIPAIHFRMGALESIRTAPDVVPELGQEAKFVWQEDNAPIFPHSQIGETTVYGSPAKKYTFDGSEFEAFWTEYLTTVWGKIDMLVQEQRTLGKAVFPFFVRYAVRLYDGTLYAQSIPVLIGADIDKFCDVKAVVVQQSVGQGDTETHGRTEISSYVKLASSYSLVAKAFGQDSIFNGWEDIVSSVDLFVSPQMMPFQRNAATLSVKFEQESGSYNNAHRFYAIGDFVLDPYYAVEHQDELVMNQQNTFLAKSFTIDEFKALGQETFLEDIDYSADRIMTQEAMKESSWSMHHSVGGGLFNYNKRLLMSDVKQSLYHGYPFYHSAKWVDATANPVRLRFVYYLRGEGGEAVVVCRDHVGNMEITPQKAEVTGHFQQYYEEKAVAWLAYPDSRCYRMDVYAISPGGGVSYASYQMKPMSGIDVAYAFLGFGTEITPATASVREVSENAFFVLPNQLFVSKTNNPFVFPADETVTFTAGKIMNLAAVTIPLSEGQAGQFDLYVFTDEGIYALSPDSEGSLRTSHCVSRDILISKDAVAGIEQGVFFAAARGLLLLRGSTVTKVSDAIEGPTVTMDSDLMASISEKHFGGMALEPQQPFHEFLFGCRIAYDYASTRIILMNEAHRTMYVYKFDTQTWHRMDMGLGYPVRTLNSFPEAFIVTRAQGEDGTQAVYNFSVVLESAHAEVAPGLIITRPFDLGEPDVRKAVRDLRVRGNFHRHDVAYILFGSFDGIHWVRLRSLHGGSFKQFRMMILTGLSPTERISWVDVDYDTRFTNKLR